MRRNGHFTFDDNLKDTRSVPVSIPILALGVKIHQLDSLHVGFSCQWDSPKFPDIFRVCFSQVMKEGYAQTGISREDVLFAPVVDLFRWGWELSHLCRGVAVSIWVNYNELTASSLEIIVSKGNHPQMALIQVSELL